MFRVLIAAEAYGFGPAAKALAIGKALSRRSVEWDCVLEGTAHQFFSEEIQLPPGTRIIPMEELPKLQANPYTACVSVMEPLLSAWSAFNGLPLIYVDSLCWFWDWPGDVVASALTYMTRPTQDALSSQLDNFKMLSMTEAQYVAHAKADLVLAQEVPGIGFAGSPFNLLSVPPVLTLPQPPEEAKLCHWLVSLSGLVNVFTTVDEASGYALAACRLVRAALDSTADQVPVVVSGNRSVLTTLEGKLPPGFTLTTQNHDQLLQSVITAYACFAPPGLTTLLESVALGTPVIALPQQHYGHERIFRQFSSLDPDAFPRALLESPPQASGEEKDDSVTLLRRFVQLEASRSAEWTRLIDALSLGVVTARQNRAAMSGRQAAALSPSIISFDGDEVCADIILQHLVGLSRTDE